MRSDGFRLFLPLPGFSHVLLSSRLALRAGEAVSGALAWLLPLEESVKCVAARSTKRVARSIQRTVSTNQGELR